MLQDGKRVTQTIGSIRCLIFHSFQIVSIPFKSHKNLNSCAAVGLTLNCCKKQVGVSVMKEVLLPSNSFRH